MTDLSTLPVPEECPFSGAYWWNNPNKHRFMQCATMTTWLSIQIEFQNDSEFQSISDDYLDELHAMYHKWLTAQDEAYAAIKEQSNG